MKNETCGECKHYKDGWCVYSDEPFEVEKDSPSCGDQFFSPKPTPTNGDVIRQGGDKRLITFATEWSCFHCVYRNATERKCERPKGKDCFDGMLAWLNAPADCVKQNGNHDTQADLCKAGKTESEVKDE